MGKITMLERLQKLVRLAEQGHFPEEDWGMFGQDLQLLEQSVVIRPRSHIQAAYSELFMASAQSIVAIQSNPAEATEEMQTKSMMWAYTAMALDWVLNYHPEKEKQFDLIVDSASAYTGDVDKFFTAIGGRTGEMFQEHKEKLNNVGQQRPEHIRFTASGGIQSQLSDGAPTESPN